MRLAISVLGLTLSAPLLAGAIPLLPDWQVTALASELSGESAKRNLEGFSRLHRMRGSRDFRRAGEQVVAELKKYGFEDAYIEQLAADGKIFYGTQRSRPAWDADFADLWELDGSGKPATRMASWDDDLPRRRALSSGASCEGRTNPFARRCQSWPASGLL